MKTPTTTSAKAAAVTPEEVKDRVAVKYGYQDWQHLNFTHFNNYFDGLNVGQKAKVRKEYMVYENEAMRDYASASAKAAADEAEALYKDRIEKAGSELPTADSIREKAKSEFNYYENNYVNESTKEENSLMRHNEIIKRACYELGSDWMKEQASVVIAKERERHPKLVFDEKGMLISGECLKRDLVLFQYESNKFITQEKFEGKKHFISGYNRAFEHLNEILEQKDREIKEWKIKHEKCNVTLHEQICKEVITTNTKTK